MPVGSPLLVPLDAPTEEVEASSMWVINVLSTDNRSPTVDKTVATSGSSASVCDRVPATRITKSSAYVDRRIMPTVA